MGVQQHTVFWTLTGISVATRLWNLDQPPAVVFDELHYVQFVSFYLNRTFHFDPDPPLGKLLVSASAWLSGSMPSHNFTKIGDVYPSSMNIWWMRFVPAILGSFLAPAAFQIMLLLNFDLWTSALAAALVILENALLTQSRFVLMEGPLVFFIALATLSYIQFRKVNSVCPFTFQWFVWFGCLSLFLSFAICIKYIALCSVSLLAGHLFVDFWKILPDKSVSNRAILKHLLAQIFFLGVVPVVMYLLVFRIHFALLINAGPHDDIMTSSFQANLKGGLSSITNSQPQFVAYGSQITLRRTYGKPCWLHSHDHLYPVQYADGRGSSHQQQVTCYSFKDVNNWWIVKDPKRNSLVVGNPVRYVHNGDVIQLIHGMTSRALNSHDVAAPMSPHFPEVSCYVNYGASSPAQTLWAVKIVNADKGEERWRMITSTVQLIHLNSSHALKTSGRHLDEWGFFQLEVVTDKLQQQPSTIWNVEEHRYSHMEEAKVEESADLQMVEKEMGFFSKLWELQLKMVTWQLEASREHRYSSDPLDWPLMTNNIIYWVNTTTHSQIHLIGNASVWFPATASVVIYALVLGVYLLRRRRLCYDLSVETWNQFVDTGGLLFAGYLAHYLPFLLIDRTLFLYQYLPALFFKILLLAAVIKHVYITLQSLSLFLSYVFLSSVGVWFVFVLSTFLKYSSLTFGLVPVTFDVAHDLQLFETWDFIIKPD